ncbi:hypothetical protein MBH78_18990 [Oceanimonas sp. NS1]|nr:hypothetical protein [Oceanimonas sp. NS1]
MTNNEKMRQYVRGRARVKREEAMRDLGLTNAGVNSAIYAMTKSGDLSPMGEGGVPGNQQRAATTADPAGGVWRAGCGVMLDWAMSALGVVLLVMVIWELWRGSDE